jgi:cysteinyl-tRNA synthetase
MTLKLFNTLTRKKEEFEPLEDKIVKIYTCGPTVYDFAHIGNFRTFVFQDILRRYLKWKGFKVKQVMNITDVDDKTIEGSKDEKIPLKEFTKKYERVFHEDRRALRIEDAEFYPRATEHINDMVDLIEILLKKKIAYKGEDGSIYFSIKKFKDYGKLAQLEKTELKPGARVSIDSYSKEEAEDFALWKAWTIKDGDVFWDAELGRGRPGWHIECSTMAMKYLGETIDIHSGGVDLIFPHHENEIAQSEAATGKKFVNYWVHGEHMLINGRKMSKSIGNILTLKDIIGYGYDPVSLRFLFISSDYREQLNFSYDALDAAKKTLMNLNSFVKRLKELEAKGDYNNELFDKLEKTRNAFEKNMDDDFNIPHALSVIFYLIRETNKAIDENKVSTRNLQEVLEFILSINKIFDVLEAKEEKIPKEISDLAFKREGARKRGDFAQADKIRIELKNKGYLIEDTPRGPRVRKLS